MARKSKLLKIVLVVLVALAALGAVALTLDYDSPELGRAILARVGQHADLDLRAEGFHLNLLRGLRLEDVEVVSRTPGTDLHARADRLVLAHRLGPLLRGKVLVEEVVLERPAVELVSSAEPAAAPSTGGASGGGTTSQPTPTSAEEAATPSGFEVSISRFAIVDGSVVIRSTEGTDAAAPEATEIRGFNLELRDVAVAPAAASLVQGLTAHGEITADEVTTSAAQARDARGQVRVEGGHLRIEDFQLPTVQGRLVVGELDADFNASPYTYTLTVAGDPLNTNLIVGGEADGDLGDGRLDLDLSGDGSESGNLAGGGVLNQSAGALPGLPVLAALETLVTGTPIIGQSYEPFEVRFGIRNDSLEIEPFDILCGDIKLSFSGTVGFSGALALRSAFSAPREGVGALVEIPKEVVEALTDADGRVNLPITIGGTQTSPKVAFDRSGWGKMAKKRLEKEAEKEIGKALGKLFGKKKDGP